MLSGVPPVRVQIVGSAFGGGMTSSGVTGLPTVTLSWGHASLHPLLNSGETHSLHVLSTYSRSFLNGITSARMIMGLQWLLLRTYDLSNIAHLRGILEKGYDFISPKGSIS